MCAQDTVCRCLMDIAAGMDYLHTLGVLHGALYHLPSPVPLLCCVTSTQPSTCKA